MESAGAEQSRRFEPEVIPAARTGETDNTTTERIQIVQRPQQRNRIARPVDHQKRRRQ